MLRVLTLPGLVALIVIISVAGLPAAAAPLAVPLQTLGTAASFAVLGGTAVTNTGPTVVTGEVGVSPSAAITGFPPGVVVPPGTLHSADAAAAQAQIDVTTAYNTLAGLPPTATLTGQDLGGLTLTAGVYFFATSAGLTGDLRLDAQGDPYAVFVFQIGSTLVTASSSRVILINGASPCNVWWQVGSSATLGTSTAFTGNILALTSITLNTAAALEGRALARNGAVTLDTNVVSAPNCLPVLSLIKLSTNANGAPRPGDVLSYTLIVSNTGQTVATNVSLSDTVPGYTTYVPGSIGGDSGAANGNLLTWTIGSLLPGADQAITLTFAVTIDTPLTNGTEIVNTGVVTSTEVTTPTTATVTDTVTSQSLLSLSKRSTDVNGESVQPGDVLSYTLIVTNTGDAVATNVIVRDTVPADTQYVLNSIAGGSARDASGAPLLTWTINTLSPGAGQAVALMFAVTIATPLTDGTHIVNSGTVTSTETRTPITATVTDTVSSTPTAVELLYFRADRLLGQQVRLQWATASEVDNFGFNLYRANVADLAQASLIHFEPAVAQGSAPGATYIYADTAPSDGTWWYWLADVDTTGRETVHDGISAMVSFDIWSFSIYLPMIVRGID